MVLFVFVFISNFEIYLSVIYKCVWIEVNFIKNCFNFDFVLKDFLDSLCYCLIDSLGIFSV